MTTATKGTNIINGKPSKIVATRAWDEMYGGLEAVLYVRTAIQLLQKHPYDMLVFEQPEKGYYQVRLAGYHLTKDELDEKTVVFKTQSLDIKKFWVKVDDYNDHYVITFLFPEDY